MPRKSTTLEALVLIPPVVLRDVSSPLVSPFACGNNSPGFKECTICAHTIAMAHDSGKLTDFLKGYKVQLEKMVNACIPAGSGKKENEKRIWRKRKSHAERDVSAYGDRLIDTSAELSPSTEACGDNTLTKWFL